MDTFHSGRYHAPGHCIVDFSRVRSGAKHVFYRDIYNGRIGNKMLVLITCGAPKARQVSLLDLSVHVMTPFRTFHAVPAPAFLSLEFKGRIRTASAGCQHHCMCGGVQGSRMVAARTTGAAAGVAAPLQPGYSCSSTDQQVAHLRHGNSALRPGCPPHISLPSRSFLAYGLIVGQGKGSSAAGKRNHTLIARG